MSRKEVDKGNFWLEIAGKHRQKQVKPVANQVLPA
jgi:hypothetical protein